ncbi:MAG: hypothetical protein JJT94_08905 [Bernardetiaceae bacterium]|nr:hypothetical protein [Bernardetiaceae bacterium]
MNISESKKLLAKLQATNQKLKETSAKVSKLNESLGKEFGVHPVSKKK